MNENMNYGGFLYTNYWGFFEFPYPQVVNSWTNLCFNKDGYNAYVETKHMKLVILIPAFNEEKNIIQTINSIPKSFPGIEKTEILVLDDGSKDKTADLARLTGAAVVSHLQNRGVGAAFHSAVQYALENEADIMVGIDADGQFDSAEIPLLVNPILNKNADMVVGNRFTAGRPDRMPWIKYVGNQQVANLVSRVCGKRFTDVSCGFRAYNRETLLRFNIYGQFTYTHETIISAVLQGLKVIEVPISVTYDPDRESRVAGSIFNYASRTSKIILRVFLDYRPMRAFGSAGLICILIGLFFGFFLLIHYLLTGSFTPYKTFGFLSLGFGIFGLIVLMIALISDMLNRMKANQEKILYEMKKMRYGK